MFTTLHFFDKNSWTYYFTCAYQKSWYDLQFLRHRVWQTEISNFRSFFALLLLETPKNQNFKKMKKNTGDIIILLMCTENHNHMM